LIELEIHLKIEPEFRLDAQRLREVESSFSRDPLLASNDFTHQLFGTTDFFGKCSL